MFVAPGLDVTQTPDKLPAPVNLTAYNGSVPSLGPFNASTPGSSSAPAPPAGGSSGASKSLVGSVAVAVAAAGVAVFVSL